MSTIYVDDGIRVCHSTSENPDSSDFVLHVHDSYEILCFVKGNARYLVEGNEYNMYPGCVMLMRPAELHKLLVLGKDCYERYIINFYPEKLRELGISEDMLTAYTDRALGERNQYMSSEFGGIDPIGLLRHTEEECKVIDKRRAVTATVSVLLCAVNTAFAKKSARDDGQAVHEIGRILIDYVNQNLTEEISLSSVSEHVHMSPSQVNRIFRRLTGTTVYDYVLSKRIVMAQELIASGESASSACQRCGFGDYSSFYRLYKSRIGSSPVTKRGVSRQ